MTISCNSKSVSINAFLTNERMSGQKTLDFIPLDLELLIISRFVTDTGMMKFF